MRIRKIEVKNLFGIFYHEIPLNMKDRITIIHGPNGYGKTVLLTMLNALFNANYRAIQSIPFGEMRVDFEDKSSLIVKKRSKIETQEKNGTGLLLELSKGHLKAKTHLVEPRISQQEFRFPLSIIEKEIPTLDRIGPEAWVHMPTQEPLSLEEVLDRFGDRLPNVYHRISKTGKEPDWLQKMRGSIHIRFIGAQRLYTFAKFRRPRDYEGMPPMVPSVTSYSEELANQIQAKLAEYATLSQSLDRTFPTRLVKESSALAPTIEELRNNLAELEEKRSRLMAAGLLDKEKEIDFKDMQQINESNRNVLSVYIEDVRKKLSVLDELTNKIDLLVKIINSRFLYKQLSISKKDGFMFRTSEGKDISPIKLSSGEQQELVLLYELLFKVTPNSLILIDEPELSLHILWQQEFLRDLEEIIKIAGLDFLIATHSPQIIHNRWDLAVELKGPVK